MWRCAAIALLSLALTGVAWADTSGEVRIVKIRVGGHPLTSFDIGWTDAAAGRYYLADQSNKSVDLFDTHKNTLVTEIGGFVGFTGNADTSGPNGIVSTSHGELWVGDGDSTVKVVDVPSGAVTRTISTGGKARANKLAYDPNDRLVVVANDADVPPFLTFISVPNRSVIGRVRVADATDRIEQTVYDPNANLFYIAIASTMTHPGGEIRQYDANLVLAGIAPLLACNPHGLALGPGHQLLAGCSSTSHTLILDDTTWSVIADIPQTSGSDEVWYNAGDGHYYLAENVAQYVGVIDAATLHFVENVETGVNAHSVAVDESLNHVFVPIAAPDPACPEGCIAVFSTVTSDRASQK